MPVVLKTFRMPSWLAPVLLVLALVLVPFALMLALGLGALALVGGLASAILPNRRMETRAKTSETVLPAANNERVIDAEYEVRDEL